MTKKSKKPDVEIKNEHAECEKKIAELTEDLQRIQAEFENYRKRTEKDYEKLRQHASCDVLRLLLPVLDSFEAALKDKGVDKGFQFIYNQLMSVLAGQGLQEIKCIGKEYDAYRHEVLCSEESEKDGIVLDELQKGYVVKDRVIRHSKVKIGKKGKGQDSKEDKPEADNEVGQ
ncbi:MAG: nucleotide exchange factor GrpE [Candidatus Woesearchaeota archaeon]